MWPIFSRSHGCRVSRFRTPSAIQTLLNENHSPIRLWKAVRSESVEWVLRNDFPIQVHAQSWSFGKLQIAVLYLRAELLHFIKERVVAPMLQSQEIWHRR